MFKMQHKKCWEVGRIWRTGSHFLITAIWAPPSCSKKIYGFCRMQPEQICILTTSTEELQYRSLICSVAHDLGELLRLKTISVLKNETLEQLWNVSKWSQEVRLKKSYYRRFYYCLYFSLVWVCSLKMLFLSLKEALHFVGWWREMSFKIKPKS